jgi:hypothetical protein
MMEQEIIELYPKNSLNKISNLIGVSKYQIKKILSKNNIKLRTVTENILLSRNITDFEKFSKENIERMYNTMSVYDIADILGIHYRNVYSWLKKYGIKTKASVNNETIYYVYVLCDPHECGFWRMHSYEFCNKPFYVGYGKSDRCFQHMANHSLNKCNSDKNDIINFILNNNSYPIIHKLKTGLTISEAMKIESDMINCDNIKLTNKTNGGEIGGRYMKKIAKYKPNFTTFKHKLIETYISINEAELDNGISKINFKGISGGYVFEKFDNEAFSVLYRELSEHTIKVYGGINVYPNPVCVYDINGNFVKLSKQNIKLSDISFRMPNNLYLYHHTNGYYCVRKDNIDWDYHDNILKHTIMKNGKLTLSNL